MQDKRTSQRASLIATAEITEVATGTRLSARTSDLSRSGCYVDTLNPTPSKTVIRIRLTHNNEELDLPARVVYVSPGLGMGIRFEDNLTPDQIATMDRWIAGAR